MIVNYTEHGWELITQRAHGILAAVFASHWRHDVRTEKWLETLLAIAEHDDARVEPIDDAVLTKQGGPLNFKMIAFDYEHCVRTYEASLSKSRYVALLCSMHLDFVYGRLSQGHAEGIRFMKEQAALREKWMKELGINQEMADRDYRLLEWCDALSLLICQQEYQPEGRSVEISVGPDGQRHLLTQSTPGVLHVSPWPFEESEFEVYLESRLLEQLTFKGNNEFHSAFHSAEVITKRWIIKALEPVMR